MLKKCKFFWSLSLPLAFQFASMYTVQFVFVPSSMKQKGFCLAQVKEELDLATSESKVYKLIGPALVQQDLDEAKTNVEKRIGYISGELKRKDQVLKEMDKSQDAAREKMQEIQMQLQKIQQAPN